MIKSHQISYYTLYALFAVIIAVLCMFFFGGDAQGDAVMMHLDPGMWQPANTDAMLYLNYALFVLAAIASVVSFFWFMVCNPKASMGSLQVALGSIIVLAITWFMGSPEKIDIVGYEGNQNEGMWAQVADMFIYALYALSALAVLGMILGGLKKKLS